MRRSLPFLFALAAVLVGFWGPGRQRRARPAPSGRPAAPRDERSGLQSQGPASCAAVACHNAHGPQGSRGSEYTTWVAHDPHAQAYTVLTEPRSYAIFKNYYRRSRAAPVPRPDRDPLCLNCHLEPGLATLNRDDRFSPADGVSCEACHGPAQKWLARHHRDDWRRLSAAQKQALGMADTRDVLARAEVCVGCHVGRGGTGVNHDLI